MLFWRKNDETIWTPLPPPPPPPEESSPFQLNPLFQSNFSWLPSFYKFKQESCNLVLGGRKVCGQNTDSDIFPDISGQSLIKENCRNSRTSDDINMKLGPVTKHDKKKKTTSKKSWQFFQLQDFIPALFSAAVFSPNIQFLFCLLSSVAPWGGPMVDTEANIFVNYVCRLV